jgi:hypothetical protein
MGLIRRRRRPRNGSGAAAAVEAAAKAGDAAGQELVRQSERAAAEHREIVTPLRQARQRNHLAEDIATMLVRGYGGRRA